MEHLGNGLITLLNGGWATLTAVVEPLLLGSLVLGGGFAWLARLEVDELDRSASKPTVGRH